MTEARSKRRILPLIFIVKSFKKPLLIYNVLVLISLLFYLFSFLRRGDQSTVFCIVHLRQMTD